MDELIDFRVNGKVYTGYKSLTLTRSVEAISSYFNFEFTDTFDNTEPWPMSPQDEVEIYLGGQPLVTGYIDVVSGSLSDTNRTYSVEGRDKTSDLIDCVLPDIQAQYSNIKFIDLCHRLTKDFGISFYESAGDFNKGPMNFTGQIGDTVFENLDRAANRAGALLVPDGRGGIQITVQGFIDAEVDLVEGDNIIALDFKRDFTQRFSEYVVEGRARSPKTGSKGEGWFPPKKGKGGPVSAPRSELEDTAIRRYRPFLVRPNGNVSTIETDAIVAFEVATRIAKSLEINVTVRGWVQKPGRPWLINELVKVYAPRLGIGNDIAEQYLIAETEYSLSPSSGATTTMRLLPKDAFLNPIVVDKMRKKERDKKGQGIRWFGPDYKGGINVILPTDKVPTKRSTYNRGDS